MLESLCKTCPLQRAKGSGRRGCALGETVLLGPHLNRCCTLSLAVLEESRCSGGSRTWPCVRNSDLSFAEKTGTSPKACSGVFFLMTATHSAKRFLLSLSTELDISVVISLGCDLSSVSRWLRGRVRCSFVFSLMGWHVVDLATNFNCLHVHEALDRLRVPPAAKDGPVEEIVRVLTDGGHEHAC